MDPLLVSCLSNPKILTNHLIKRQGNPEIYNLTAKYYLLTVIRFSYSVSAITFLTFSGFFNFRFHSLTAIIHHI